MSKLYTEVLSSDIRADRNKAKKNIGAEALFSSVYEQLCRDPESCSSGALTNVTSNGFEIGTNLVKWIRFEI